MTGPSTNVQYVYDGDGNRVQVIDNTHSTTTSLLVDSNNLTGYAQVLETLQGGGVNKVYTVRCKYSSGLSVIEVKQAA